MSEIMIGRLLDKFREVIRDGLREEEQEHYINALNNLHQRWKSPIMKVAVIGEFNSGKSTFINALIQRKLLKSKSIRTTASAVTLSMDSAIRSVSCQVTMKDSYHCVIPQSNGSDASAYFKRKYGVKFSDVQEFIDLISAEQKVAQDVRSAHIALPASEQGDTLALPNNIHIIDTPGYDPGDDSEVKHSEVTKAAVRDDADLALVLMPGGHAMPKDLITFLSDHVRDYLHRCIFVITKTDILDEDERVEMVDYVRKILQEHFSLSHPLVYTVAAGKVLPGKNVDAAAKADFLGFRHKLLKRLNSCREEVIAEHVLRLTKELVTPLKKSLKNTEVALRNAEDVLKRNDIKHIEDALGETLRECLEKFDEAFIEEYTGWDDLISEKWTELANCCFAIVNEGGSADDFKTKSLPRIKGNIQSSLKKIMGDFQKKRKKMDGCVRKLQDRLLRQFEKNYQDLPALKPSPSYMLSLVDKYNFKSSMEISDVSLDWGQTAVGAGVGAFLGTLLAPGIGTIIGGAVGGWLSKGIDKDKARENVAKVVKDCINRAYEIIKKDIDEGYEMRRNSLIQLVANHIEQYGQDVESLIESHKNMKKLYQTRIRSNQKAQSKLNALTNEISAQLNYLRQI